MKSQILLNRVPNQRISVNIDDVALDLTLRTGKTGGLYADLDVDGAGVFRGRACVNKMPLLLNNSLNGNLYFEDLFGNENPVYTGFNERFALFFDDEYEL